MNIASSTRRSAVLLGLVLLLALAVAVAAVMLTGPAPELRAHGTLAADRIPEDASGDTVDDPAPAPERPAEAQTAAPPTTVPAPAPAPSPEPVTAPGGQAPVPSGGAQSGSACSAGAEERVSDLWAGPGVDCATAQQVAAAFDQQVMAGGNWPGQEPVDAQGFACTAQPVGPSYEETSQVQCADAGHTVRFQWGV